MPVYKLVQGARPPSKSELNEIRKEAERVAIKEKLEQEQKVIALTNSHVWETFYHNLRPEHFKAFAQDGIPHWVVDTFMFGFNPVFSIWDWEESKHIQYEAFTFPVFRWMTIDGKTGWYCVNIRHRLIGAARDKYRPYSAGLGIDYFRAVHTKGKLIITEGEKKAAVLFAKGFNAIGLWGVEVFQESWIPEIRQLGSERFVIFDRDGDLPLDEIEKLLKLQSGEFQKLDPDIKKQANAWRIAKRLADQLEGTAVFLPKPGKVDDVLVHNAVTPAQLSALLVSKSKFVIR